jgi:hypothetical protein
MTALKKQAHTEEVSQKTDTNARGLGGTSQTMQLVPSAEEGDARTPGPIKPTRESSIQVIRTAATPADESEDARTPGPIKPTRETFVARQFQRLRMQLEELLQT